MIVGMTEEGRSGAEMKSLDNRKSEAKVEGKDVTALDSWVLTTTFNILS